MNARTLDPAHHLIEKEPYYEAVGEGRKSSCSKPPTGSRFRYC